MVKNHLSRLVSPKVWGIAKKGKKWVARPSAGPHALKKCLTINKLLQEDLIYATRAKEVKKILNGKELLVDKIVRKDYKFPLGFMDVVEFPSLKEAYRIVYNTKGVFVPIKIDEKESSLKLLKIIGKKLIKGGKMQLNFYDGKNLIVDATEAKVGDTVLFDLVKKQIVKSFSLKEGVTVYIDAGKHAGSIGTIKKITKTSDSQDKLLTFEVKGTEHITLLEYAFVVGDKKAELALGESK